MTVGLRIVKGGSRGGADKPPSPPPPGGGDGGGGGDPPRISNAWKSHLTYNKAGPLPTVNNLVLYLKHEPEWQGVLQYDLFSQRICFAKDPPWGADFQANEPPAKANPHASKHTAKIKKHVGHEVTDVDMTRAAMWLERKQKVSTFKPTSASVGEAMEVVARTTCVHPVRQYLDSLVWDGKQRVGRPREDADADDEVSWLSKFLGCEDTAYVRSVGRWWLISAIARIYSPGCQADHTVIFEGSEGLGKSQALRALGEPWFTDDLEDITNKDALQQLAGIWIIEIGELDAILRANEKTAQKFLTKKEDRYRPPYARRPRDFPRQCVFAGTTNKATYLREATGNRRYWPVVTRAILLDELREERDQLWAEAKILYEAGEAWWPSATHEIAQLRDEQEDRVEQDPWFDLVHDWMLDQRRKMVETTTIATARAACAATSTICRSASPSSLRPAVAVVEAAPPGVSRTSTPSSGRSSPPRPIGSRRPPRWPWRRPRPRKRRAGTKTVNRSRGSSSRRAEWNQIRMEERRRP